MRDFYAARSSGFAATDEALKLNGYETHMNGPDRHMTNIEMETTFITTIAHLRTAFLPSKLRSVDGQKHVAICTAK